MAGHVGAMGRQALPTSRRPGLIRGARCQFMKTATGSQPRRPSSRVEWPSFGCPPRSGRGISPSSPCRVSPSLPSARQSSRCGSRTIPVAPETAAVLDAPPHDRLLILIIGSARPLSPHRASERLRQSRDKAGLSPEAPGCDLRHQDAKGTAATHLFNADPPLTRIAEVPGRSLRPATAVIEHYAPVRTLNRMPP